MQREQSQKRKEKHHENHNKKGISVRWIVTIFFLTVLISAVFSLISGLLLGRAGMMSAFLILLVIIFIGIAFDVIGVAVTVADTKHFHSMASHRVRGAQTALKLINNADRVSSFCNDVVGDICGIISGTATAAIVVLLLHSGIHETGDWLSIIMAACVSGLTVGGKAVGKTLAIRNSTNIVAFVSKVIYYVQNGPRLLLKLEKKKR